MEAYFFDIDGTLVFDGKIEDKEKLLFLSKNSKLFFATALPYLYAFRKCKGIMDYFSGGVFASGGDIRIFNVYQKIYPISDFDRNYFHAYRQNGEYYKIIYKSKIDIYSDFVKLEKEDRYYALLNSKASKVNGILEICGYCGYRDKDITVVGNGENDIEMLKFFTNSVAVNSAEENIRKAAKRVHTIQDL